MIDLAWPWMLVLLPLPWILYRWRSAADGGGLALFVPFAANLGAGTGGGVSGGSRRDALLLAAIWVLLVLAAARPQWLGAPVPVPTRARQVMLAVDVSGSMASQDMAGRRTRLQIVQRVAGHFIDGRQGDRVGLILFGSQPYLQAPLTTDLATVHRFLDQAVVGVAGPQTAIGDAIGLAIKRLRAARGSNPVPATRRSILVLLTDGGNNAGVLDPLQAARLAKQVGLRIYTIGVGAAVQQGFFGLTSGNTDLDQRTLQSVARITGGRYFRATDADALRAVYREIDRLEPSTGRRQWLRPSQEWFVWPLAAALLLSIPAVWRCGRSWA